MASIRECIDELQKLKANLKKSKNRAYCRKYVDEKLEKLGILSETVEKILTQSKNSEDEKLKAEFEILCKELNGILENLEIREVRQEDNLPSMANFDISLVGKNLQTFKGTFKYLEDFVTQAELLHDMLREDDKEIYVKYIYNFKLTTQVRSILGRSNRPTTFEQLRKALENAYPNPKSLQQVLTELGTTRQNDLNITSFRETIADLSDELSTFEIRNLTNATQEARDAIYRMSDSMALNIFLKGVNVEYQPILLANMPKTLNEAVERCLIAEKTLGLGKNNVYKFNSNNRGAHGGQRNYHNNNSNGNRRYTNNMNNDNINNTQRYNSDYRDNDSANNNTQRYNSEYRNNNNNSKNNTQRHNDSNSFSNQRYTNNYRGNYNNNNNRNQGNRFNDRRNRNNDGNYRSFHYTGDTSENGNSYNSGNDNQGNYNARVTEDATQEGQNEEYSAYHQT